MLIHTTACPRNCYSTCSMRVHVEDGRLQRIDPHPDNAAAPDGVCLKGLSYVERIVSPDRILAPLKKKPGTGEFERISWAEALDLIADRLTRYRREFGPQGVMYYQASGTKGLLNSAGPAFWRLATEWPLALFTWVAAGLVGWMGAGVISRVGVDPVVFLPVALAGAGPYWR